MSKLRASSYVLFHMLKEAGYVEMVDSEEVTRFNVADYPNIYECLREVLAHTDNIDEQLTARATIQTENKLFQNAFLIGRFDLDADEEVINYVETEWAVELMKQYGLETEVASTTEFMKYMMETADCRDDLWNCWNHGEFSSIQFAKEVLAPETVIVPFVTVTVPEFETSGMARSTILVL